jgi:multidrug efflux pump subunit AcrA (membrane-fusion protein)
MSNKKPFGRFIILLLVLVAAAALILIPPRLAADKPGPEGQTEQQASEQPVFSVRVAEAEIRTLKAYLEVNGDIVSARQVEVFPDVEGKLVSVSVGLGSRVQRGQLIAEVDPSRPGIRYSLSPVYAPISGTIAAAPLAAGSTVSPGSGIAVIADIQDLEIETLIPEREISQLGEGLEADVLLQAFPGMIFGARLVRVSPVIDPVSRTKKIVLKFNQNDNRINAGMFARIKLTTRTYENVLTVPSEAVADIFGAPCVYVLHNGTVEEREVIPGVTIDRLTEIKDGITPGEQVVIQGQQFISGGDTVRIIGGNK